MSNNFHYFLIKEEQLIAQEIQKQFLSTTDEIKPVSQAEIHSVNANLLLTDERNIAFKVHRELINSLIELFIKSKYNNFAEQLEPLFETTNSTINDTIVDASIESIPQIVEDLHVFFLNSEFGIVNGKLTRKKSKHYLKETGAVYTLKEITNEIVNKTIQNAITEQVIANTITCLDFASGTGRFYFEALEILVNKYELPLQNIICNNLYAVDVDNVALSVLRCKIISKFETLNDDIIKALQTNILNRNALIPKVSLLQETDNSFDLSNDFKNVFEKGGFDAVFSNPPYYLLKANKKEDEQKLNGYFVNLQNKIQNEINFFRTSGLYQYSIEGMLNYYQLSIEMILRLTKTKGQIGIICPSSIFADLTSSKLRKHLLKSNKIHFIRYYSEASKLFENVAQSTVIFYLQKNGTTDKIEIKVEESTFKVDFETIKSVFPTNFEIPLIDKIGWSILIKISNQKKIKDLSYIRNRRGELDLTLFKSFITSTNTGWRLVRGNMISENTITNKNGEFVEIESFLSKKSDDFKVNDYNKERLVCQQISNVDLKKRLKFAFAEKTDILANSCNYVLSTRCNTDLKKLHYIFNSELLNWRFKITSSNNHINNYELDDLPIIDLDKIDLEKFSKDGLSNDELICKLYGLSETEINYLLGTTEKLKHNLQYEQEAV